MAKKYKVLTAVLAALIAAAIAVVSVSASSYTSSTVYFFWVDGTEDYMYVADVQDEVYIYSPNSSWGFFHDIEIKNYHTYTVDITLHVAFPESDGDTAEIYPLPGELINICFLDGDYDVKGKSKVWLEDVLLSQKNSAGVSYADLVSVSFDSAYYAAGVTALNYHLSFSTAEGFIDTLDEGVQFLFSLFGMHPDAIEMGYGVTFYQMHVSSTYDPDGDAFQNTVIDNLGDAVGRLNDINAKLSGLQNAGSTQIKELQALKAQTESLVAKTTELYTTVDWIFRDVQSMPDRIGDEFSDALMDHDQELLDASINGGNELMEQLTEAIGGSVDANGVIDSMGGLVNVLSYEGRKSEFRIPEMSIPALAGVTSEPIQLMAATSVDFSDYIDMIPESIMTLIQWGTVVFIVINAVLTLMKFINQFLQGKSVGGEEGD